MSLVMDQDGNIPDTALYFKCREDDVWMYHYRRHVEFKLLKERFDRMCFEEYELMSLREEELIDHEI